MLYHARRYRCHAAIHALVDVLHVLEIMVVVLVVDNGRVIVRDVGDVLDVRVRNVYVAHIVVAGVIVRIVRLTPSKRHPSHAVTAAERNSYTPVRSTKPCHQRRRIYRTIVSRSGAPRPTIRGIDPTSIVERGKSPPSVVNPGPSPRLDPCPVSISIWSPTNRYSSRDPHIAVGRHRAPVTVLIQVFITDDIVGDISNRFVLIFALVANAAPVVKSVLTRRFGHRVHHRIAVLKARHLARLYFDATAVAVSLTLAATDDYGRRVAIRVYFKAVVAGLQQGERHVR